MNDDDNNNNNNDNHQFKLATVTDPKDGNPRVETTTIGDFVAALRRAPVSPTTYEGYHHHKAEEKRLARAAQAAKEQGDRATAEQLKLKVKEHKAVVNNAKFGPAVMGFVFKDDVTYKTSEGGYRFRDNGGITHFSLILLDVESKTSKEELHAVLAPFEYALWPTTSHRPDDPRYRVVLFPERPLTIAEAQALIARVDAHLPDRNDPLKKLRCIDPSSDQAGRLMFLPKWLSDHPERYELVHNRGRLITAADFPLTAEQAAAVQARAAGAEEARKTVVATNVARHAKPSGENDLIIPRRSKAPGENDWLHPLAEFETEDGWVTLRDVNGKISGVRCPFHADVVGSDFLALNRKSGRPQFVCHACGTFKMFPGEVEPTEDENQLAALIAKLQRKPITRPASKPEETRVPKTVVEFEAPEGLITVAERYLSDVRALLPAKGVLFVRSPKGTGKTAAIERIAEDCKRAGTRVVLLTHRISLARNLSMRTGLVNYQDLPPGESADQMVICVNSVTTRLDEVDANYDVVIIDESEQVLRNLLSTTLNKTISDVFNKIVLLIQHARQVLTFDADLSSELTMQLIGAIRYRVPGQNDSDDLCAIDNDYPIGRGRAVRLLPNAHQLLCEIVDSVERGNKTFVACSTARAATVIGTILSSLDGKRVLTLTSETSETPAARAFQLNPTAEAQRYDAVVASPTLQTGFSIDGAHFTHVFGHFKSVDGITFQDYDQAIARVRNEAAEVSVWIQGNEKDLVVDPIELYVQRAFYKEQKTRKKLKGEVVFTEGERLWAEVEGTINQQVALRCNHRDRLFVAAKEALGYEIVRVPLSEADTDQGKLLWAAFKSVGTNHAEQVFNAIELDPDEFMALSRKHGAKTNDQHLQLERYRLREALGRDLTLKLVQQALDENMLHQLSTIKRWIYSTPEQRAQFDSRSRERHHTAFTKASHDGVAYELLVDFLCERAGVDIVDLHERVQRGEDVEVTLPQLDRIVEACYERSADFAAHFKLRLTKADSSTESAIAARRKRAWDGTLGKVGLPLSTKRRTIDGRKVSTYFVDPKKVELTMQALQTANE